MVKTTFWSVLNEGMFFVCCSEDRSRTVSECDSGGSDASVREMRSQIKRSYFSFINTLLHNDAFPVIACQGQHVVWTVLQSVADGALHFPDPVVSETTPSKKTTMN